MRITVMIALAGCVAACGGAAGNNVAAAGNGAVPFDLPARNATDAAQQRQIPCSVQAHGMGAVTNGTAAQGACDNGVDPQTVALDELIRIVPDQHPSFYYVLASRLYAANRKDEAVFWFYAGQLRYRIRLACHPDLAPDTEPALFGSLQETVGRPVNEYAGADPAAWAAAVERARAWDAATRNGFEPKAACAGAIAGQREGMGQLIAHIRANPDAIRQQRTANGLPNR
jgi:hypothetical protein